MRRCHTDQMIADFFTKPLQGNKFKTFRELIMGWKDINSIIKYNDNDNTSPTDKEQVENNIEHVDLGNVSVSKKVSWADVVRKDSTPKQQQRMENENK